MLESFKGKKVVVTGASGYIASSLIEKLCQQKCEVVRVSRKYLNYLSNTQDIIADIREEETWTKILENADIIYHLGGNTSLKEAEENPEESAANSINPIVFFNKKCLEMERTPRLVLASTVTVYGLTDDLPVSETSTPAPVSIYDTHKYLAERRLLEGTSHSNAEGVILRLSNVYGPSIVESQSNERGILNRFAKMALLGQDLKLFGDGQYVRDYVFIDDVVNAFLIAGVAPGINGKVFNIGTGIGRTIKEAFEAVVTNTKELSNFQTSLFFEPWPQGTNSIELRNFVADVTLFEKHTGWKAVVPFELGIKRTIDHFFEQLHKDSRL
jgi:UDP-glucose 4-epimerase